MLRKNNKEKWVTTDVTYNRDRQAIFWLIKHKVEGNKAHVIKKYSLHKIINNKYKRINIQKLVLSLCVSRETILKKSTPSLASGDVSLSLSNMRQSNPTNASEDQNRRSVVSISVEGVNTKLTLATQKNSLRKVVCCGDNMNERVT